jgi:hypothetical protein
MECLGQQRKKLESRIKRHAPFQLYFFGLGHALPLNCSLVLARVNDEKQPKPSSTLGP